MECPLYIPPLGGALESYGVYLIYSPLHPTDSLLILCLVAETLLKQDVVIYSCLGSIACSHLQVCQFFCRVVGAQLGVYTFIIFVIMLMS